MPPRRGKRTFHPRVAGQRPAHAGTTPLTWVTSWLRDANETWALVANRGVSFAGKVASVASPTTNTSS